MKDGKWNFRVFRITCGRTSLLMHVTREKMALRVHFTTMEINVTRVFSWITSIKRHFWSLKLELYVLKTNDQVSCAFSWESISESFTSSPRIAPGLVFKYIELTVNSYCWIFFYRDSHSEVRFQLLLVNTNFYVILLYTQTFTQQNMHCEWLILGHVSLIKLKCIPTGIKLRSCCPRAEYNGTFICFCHMIF